jgi:anthranilate synthase
VRGIGRRQIELYSRLIHTVDHVEGRLRADRDALDGFLTHAWAVTVTGAPKLWAMQFIEDHERSPRRWYGGAIGAITVDGGINTGLTIRTMRLKDGLAEIRAGATLLFDSDPEAEDAECRLKASALVQAVREETGAAKRAAPATPDRIGAGKRILMVDCEDSFVHTLADYLRQTGASVQVVRWSAARAALQADPKPDMVALSPGPGRPDDFQLKPLIDEILKYNLRVFGVCLGMQALGEYFGATLAQLPTPVHGRSSRLTLERCALFEGCPEEAELGRYHSLYLEPATIPDVLEVVAVAPDGAPMAIQHRTLPISAVQFHPESIMSQADHVGLRIVSNAWRVNAPA